MESPESRPSPLIHLAFFHRIDDILADSDSELENDILMDDEADQRPKVKAKRAKEQKYIREDADTIVDLADINAMSKISCKSATHILQIQSLRLKTKTISVRFAASKPVKESNDKFESKKKPKDVNRGFKLADDGRLIIEEPKRVYGNGAQSDSDDDDDDDDDALPGESAKRTIADSDSDDEETENANAQKRKRKASSGLSMASGQTGKSSKYVAGGKGIHRPLGAASVRSGFSQVSKATTRAPSTAYGSEYRSKKARGDIKKKDTVDPYAYIPLSRTTLNKRKAAKSSGQFKSIVTGARKGAAAGSKRKKMH